VSTLSVLVVAADAATRLVLAGRVQASTGLTLAHAAGSVDEINPEMISVALDAVIVAIDPAANGIAEVRKYRRQHPSIGVIALTGSLSDDECLEAIRAGAAAYVPFDIPDSELMSLIRRVASGEYPINDMLLETPELSSRVLEQFRSAKASELAPHSAFAPLTDRELEILRKVSEGMRNAEIGHGLGISERTIKTHIAAILRKLAVNDRTQDVIDAISQGRLSVDDSTQSGRGKLTLEENRVMQLLKRGLSHAEIAEQMGKSAAEVTLAVRAIIRKLGFDESGGGLAGQLAPLEP
jgi:two-component system response regulator DegU